MNSERFNKVGRDIAYWVLFASSIGFGLLLSDMPNLKIYKVFNVIGVLWNIFGFVTLSYLLSTSENFQSAVLRISSFLFGILLFQLPIGLAFGGIFAYLMHYPSAEITSIIGLYLVFPGGLSMLFFIDYINPKTKRNVSIRKRVGFMGGYFLFTGLLAQFVGAIYDLIDFNGSPIV